MLDYKKCSDDELTVLMRRDDRIAFTEIYDRFRGIMYIYSRKISKGEQEAEDMVQDVFISLWDKRETFKLSGPLSSYLYTAVRYKFFDLVSRQKIRSDYATSFQQFLDLNENPTDQYINEKELQQQVEKEVANLPEKMREIFELSRNAGLSHREIAEYLDISEKTVKNQVNNALKVLRSKLGVTAFLMLLLPFK